MHVWFNFWNNAQWKAPNVMGYVSRNDNTFAHVSLWMVKLNAFVTSDEKKYVGFSLKLHCTVHTNMLEITEVAIFSYWKLLKWGNDYISENSTGYVSM